MPSSMGHSLTIMIHSSYVKEHRVYRKLVKLMVMSEEGPHGTLLLRDELLVNNRVWERRIQLHIHC